MRGQTNGYSGETFGRSHLLKNFAVQHREKFPVLTALIDWDLQTTVFQLHQVIQGTELVIHGWTRQTKILATAAVSPRPSSDQFHSTTSTGRYFVIPLTYQGLFKIHPTYLPIEYIAADLVNLPKGHLLEVVELNSSRDSLPLKAKDIIRIKGLRGHTPKQQIICEKLEDNVRLSTVNIPVDSSAVFSELNDEQGLTRLTSSAQGLGLNDDDVVTARDLVSYLSDEGKGPMAVELIQYGPDHRSEDTDLPLRTPIILRAVITEPAVYTSVQKPTAPAFHIPMRTLIYLRLIKPLPRDSSPLLMKSNPKLSTLDRSTEVIQHEVYLDLCSRAQFKLLARSVNTATGVNQMKVTKQSAQLHSTTAPQRKQKPVSSISGTEGNNKSFWNKFGLKLKRTRSTDNLSQTDTISGSQTLPVRRNKDPIKQYETRTLGRLERSGNATTTYARRGFEPQSADLEPPLIYSDQSARGYETDSTTSVRGNIPSVNNETTLERQKSDYKGIVRLPTPENPLIGLVIEPNNSLKLSHKKRANATSPVYDNFSNIPNKSPENPNINPGNKPDFAVNQGIQLLESRRDQNISIACDPTTGLMSYVSGDMDRSPYHIMKSSRGATPVSINSSQQSKSSASHDVTMRSDGTSSSYDTNNNSRRNTRHEDGSNDSLLPKNGNATTNDHFIRDDNIVRNFISRNSEVANTVNLHGTVAEVNHKIEGVANQEPKIVLVNRSNRRIRTQPTVDSETRNLKLDLDAIAHRESNGYNATQNATDLNGCNNNFNIQNKNGSSENENVILNGGPQAPRRKGQVRRVDQIDLRQASSVQTDAAMHDVGTSTGGLHSPATTNSDSTTAESAMISEMTSTTDLEVKHREVALSPLNLNHLNDFGNQYNRVSKNLNDYNDLHQESHKNSQGFSLISIEPSNCNSRRTDNPVIFPISYNIINQDPLRPNDDMRLPSDGNLYHLDGHQFIKFLSTMNLSSSVISLCRQHGIDGRRFSTMTTKDLERFGLDHPVILYFRKRTIRTRPSQR